MRRAYKGGSMCAKARSWLAPVKPSCLEDVADEELARVPVAYLDGRHDRFQSPPAETRHL